METYTYIFKIEKCSGSSEKEFYKKHVKKPLPAFAVVTDKIGWATIEESTPEYFRSFYSHHTTCRDGKTNTLSERINLCIASTPESQAPYPNIFDIHRDFPEYVKNTSKMFYGKFSRLFITDQ